jgi:hypothetical protein
LKPTRFAEALRRSNGRMAILLRDERQHEQTDEACRQYADGNDEKPVASHAILDLLVPGLA